MKRTPSGDSSDQSLSLAIVANRSAHGIDAAGQRRFRDDPPAPNRPQEVVLADNPVAVQHQVNQQVEHLWLERHRFAVAAELAPVDVEHLIAKGKFHGRSPRPGRVPRLSMNYQARLKDKSINRQSLRPNCAVGSIRRSKPRFLDVRDQARSIPGATAAAKISGQPQARHCLLGSFQSIQLGGWGNGSVQLR